MKYKLKRIDDNTVEYYDGDVLKYEHCKGSGYEEWREYDKNGNEIRYKDSKEYEVWSEYDKDGNEIYWKDSDGEEWHSGYRPKDQEPEYQEPFTFKK